MLHAEYKESIYFEDAIVRPLHLFKVGKVGSQVALAAFSGRGCKGKQASRLLTCVE